VFAAQKDRYQRLAFLAQGDQTEDPAVAQEYMQGTIPIAVSAGEPSQSKKISECSRLKSKLASRAHHLMLAQFLNVDAVCPFQRLF
jgi:hypothetical protein